MPTQAKPETRVERERSDRTPPTERDDGAVEASWSPATVLALQRSGAGNHAIARALTARRVARMMNDTGTPVAPPETEDWQSAFKAARVPPAAIKQLLSLQSSGRTAGEVAQLYHGAVERFQVSGVVTLGKVDKDKASVEDLLGLSNRKHNFALKEVVGLAGKGRTAGDVVRLRKAAENLSVGDILEMPEQAPIGTLVELAAATKSLPLKEILQLARLRADSLSDAIALANGREARSFAELKVLATLGAPGPLFTVNAVLKLVGTQATPGELGAFIKVAPAINAAQLKKLVAAGRKSHELQKLIKGPPAITPGDAVTLAGVSGRSIAELQSSTRTPRTSGR